MPVRAQNAWKKRFLRVVAYSKEGPRLRADRDLLYTLVTLSKSEGRVVVSIELLAENARLNQKTVRVGLARLREAGWLGIQPMTWEAVRVAFPNVRMLHEPRAGDAPAPNMYTVLDGKGCPACATYASRRMSLRPSDETTAAENDA